MTGPEPLSTGVAHRIGRYSDAVRVPAGYEQIFVSGTPGLRPDGSLPDDFSEEAAVSGLVWPQLRVEIEVTAVRPGPGAG
jgi:enamine deaminase RidA (YjgF/YER057c/UK114 family)